MAEGAEGGEGSGPSVDTDGVLDVHYPPAKGGGSRGEVAKWAAADWGSTQPAGLGSFLGWVAEQWVRWRAKGLCSRGLLGQLQSGSKVGLVGVLLWRQWQSSPAARGWRRQQCNQGEAERAAGRWGDVKVLSQQLTWRGARNNRGFAPLTKRRGRAGKEREAFGPV